MANNGLLTLNRLLKSRYFELIYNGLLNKGFFVFHNTFVGSSLLGF